MKKALWALAVATLLCCVDTNLPQKQVEESEENVEPVDISKFKLDSISRDISRIFFGDNQELRGLEQDLWKLGQDLIERDPHQQRIKKMVSQIKEPIIIWDLNQPNVAITIDDGYGVKSIEYMLDLFEKNDVKATFFVIWDCLKLYPDIWKRAVQQWHEICNHTATHSKYFKTWDEPERFERELLWREKIAKEVLWKDYLIKMKKNYPFFRFPGMHWIREKAYLDILKKHWYIPIGWRYTKNPENGVVNNGDIFLWHFKDQDTTNVRKNLELILKNGKHAKKVSDIIFWDGYDEPIWWHNVYTKKGQK